LLVLWMGCLLVYLSLEVANQQSVEDLARLVAVAHVFECLCCILTSYVHEDFLATPRLPLLAIGVSKDLVCKIERGEATHILLFFSKRIATK
jgi:hypothetical protein